MHGIPDSGNLKLPRVQYSILYYKIICIQRNVSAIVRIIIVIIFPAKKEKTDSARYIQNIK